jgi:hypothetical protein
MDQIGEKLIVQIEGLFNIENVVSEGLIVGIGGKMFPYQA